MQCNVMVGGRGEGEVRGAAGAGIVFETLAALAGLVVVCSV